MIAKNIDKVYVATSEDESDDVLYEHLVKKMLAYSEDH